MTAGRTHVSVRFGNDEIARIDALGPAMSHPWHVATRSDILRALILKALPLIEAEQRAARRTAAQKARRP